MNPRPAIASLILIACTLIAGLMIRFAQLGLPRLVMKYGGSMLWALMIYWIVSGVLRGWPPQRSALAAGVSATGIEFFKLYHAPGLDAFRTTLPGVLLLGRIFSGWDIVAYWLAIAAGALADIWIRRHARA